MMALMVNHHIAIERHGGVLNHASHHYRLSPVSSLRGLSIGAPRCYMGSPAWQLCILTSLPQHGIDIAWQAATAPSSASPVLERATVRPARKSPCFVGYTFPSPWGKAWR